MSVRRARGELGSALANWGLAAIEDAALLVLSELMTNAVVHARVPPGREIETQFLPQPNGVRIQVDDADDTRPQLSDQGMESGRGLVLVAKLSDRWGVSGRNGVGKSVWAVVTAPREGWA
ncbi:ATP-binding protein [Streptomyces olivoreticuli]